MEVHSLDQCAECERRALAHVRSVHRRVKILK